MYELDKLKISSGDMPITLLKENLPEMSIDYFQEQVADMSRQYIMRSINALYGKKKPKKLKDRPFDVRLKLAVDKFAPSQATARNKADSLIAMGLSDEEFLEKFKQNAYGQVENFFDIFVQPAIDEHLNTLRQKVADTITLDDKFGSDTTELLCAFFGIGQYDVPFSWVLDQFHSHLHVPDRYTRKFNFARVTNQLSGLVSDKNLTIDQIAKALTASLIVCHLSIDDIKAIMQYYTTNHSAPGFKDVNAYLNEHLFADPLKELQSVQIPIEEVAAKCRVLTLQMELISQYDPQGRIHYFYAYTAAALDEKTHLYMPIKVLTQPIEVSEDVVFPGINKLYTPIKYDRWGHPQAEGVPRPTGDVLKDAQYLRDFDYGSDPEDIFRETCEVFRKNYDQAIKFKKTFRSALRVDYPIFAFAQAYDEILKANKIEVNQDNLYDRNGRKVALDSASEYLLYSLHPHYRQVFRQLTVKMMDELSQYNFKNLMFVFTSSLIAPVGDIVEPKMPQASYMCLPLYDLLAIQNFLFTERVWGYDTVNIVETLQGVSTMREACDKVRDVFGKLRQQEGQVRDFVVARFAENMSPQVFKLSESVRNGLFDCRPLDTMRSLCSNVNSTYVCTPELYSTALTYASATFLTESSDGRLFSSSPLASDKLCQEFVQGLDRRQSHLPKGGKASAELAVEQEAPVVSATAAASVAQESAAAAADTKADAALAAPAAPAAEAAPAAPAAAETVPSPDPAPATAAAPVQAEAPAAAAAANAAAEEAVEKASPAPEATAPEVVSEEAKAAPEAKAAAPAKVATVKKATTAAAKKEATKAATSATQATPTAPAAAAAQEAPAKTEPAPAAAAPAPAAARAEPAAPAPAEEAPAKNSMLSKPNQQVSSMFSQLSSMVGSLHKNPFKK